MKKLAAILLIVSLVTSCAKTEPMQQSQISSAAQSTASSAAQSGAIKPEEPKPAVKALEKYKDIRAIFEEDKKVYEQNEYNPEDIFTYSFNEQIIFKGSEELAAQIMEEGKNPGLGVRELHKQGITGKGVNVAIIDQNLILDHPEFEGKIVKYYDTGCETEPGSGSMHAPAVTSILVGETVGVAPDAKVYYAAAPSWLADSEYYAKALYWIIEENKKLPENEKIRVVSVSAAPSGGGSPFNLNTESYVEAVTAANSADILVLDCRTKESSGFCAPGIFDYNDREDAKKAKGGFPGQKSKIPEGKLCVPCAYRTVAEEYQQDKPAYQYYGRGGLSWGIPYAAGVLALGWQVNPDLQYNRMVEILKDTAAAGADGSSIIDPPAFIDAVKATLKN